MTKFRLCLIRSLFIVYNSIDGFVAKANDVRRETLDRMIFLNGGWMSSYDGIGTDKIVNGGAYIKKAPVWRRGFIISETAVERLWVRNDKKAAHSISAVLNLDKSLPATLLRT